MASSSLQNPSSSASSRLASARLTTGSLAASQARAGATVRWGSAVVEPARRELRRESGTNREPRRSTTQCWQEASTASRRGRRTTVWVDGSRLEGGRSGLSEPAAVASYDASEVAGSFTQNRIRYAFELFGACMLIVTFLALAMFA
jgi:hypothetical protein